MEGDCIAFRIAMRMDSFPIAFLALVMDLFPIASRFWRWKSGLFSIASSNQLNGSNTKITEEHFVDNDL